MLKEIASDIAKLARRLESLEGMMAQISREVGASSGKVLSTQIDNLESGIRELKSEVDHIHLDTNNIRKVQEYGSNDMQEVKKALAAIYRNTDELEGLTLSEDERMTK